MIGLQSTGEAAADALGLEPGPVPGFVSTTKELLARFVATHFPIHHAPSPEGRKQGAFLCGGSQGGAAGWLRAYCGCDGCVHIVVVMV